METDVEKVKRLTRWQRLGLAALFLCGVAIVGFGVFVWSGVYNISARADHWRPTDWIIARLRDQSIAARTGDIDVPDLSDLGLARLGAEHFRTGCATCHGLPGREKGPVYANMLPEPPDLSRAAENYTTEELFWIIYHGLKYTGMPAWAGEERRREVWALVALLQLFNEEGVERYSELIGSQHVSECARCHGDNANPPISSLVPVLNGQSAMYLERALREYRDGIRQSGIMEPLAHGMTDDQIASAAREYSAMMPPENMKAVSVADEISAGKILALAGTHEDGVPPCQSCHGGANPQYPVLAGQPAQYLFNQLELFAAGGRDASGYGGIMTTIAKRMSVANMQAVAEYYAALPLFNDQGQRDE